MLHRNETGDSGPGNRDSLLASIEFGRSCRLEDSPTSSEAFREIRSGPLRRRRDLSLAFALLFEQLNNAVKRLTFHSTRSRVPIGVGSALIVGFVGLLLASSGVDTVSAAEEQPESFVTRLEPGANLIGWTDDTAPVQSIFDAVPEIRQVWVWDSSLRTWRFASPSVPARLWTLDALTPGMGLRVHLGGQHRVDWRRHRRPKLGTVPLNAGWNLVAWMGRSEAPLDLVARGMGRSLRGVARIPEHQTLYWQVGRQQSTDEQLRLQHGQAVWVNVERAVRWMQPTGILPEIIIAGSVSEQIERHIRTDMRQVVDFYYETFGLEADFSRFQVYIPTDIDALVDAWQQHSPNRLDPDDDRSFFSISWGSFGWASTDYMVVKAELWTSAATPRQGAASSSRGQNVAEHEYAHVLQFQLSGQSRMPGEPVSYAGYGLTDLYPPSWLMEGMALWIGYVRQMQNGREWADLHRTARSYALGGQPLAVTERSTDVNYAQGTAAAFQLANTPSDDGLFELFRSVGRTSFGSAHQLTTFTPWRTAFADVFGYSLKDFYSLYDREHEVGNEDLGVHTHKHAPPLITGSLDGSQSLHGQYVKVGIWPTAVLGIASWDWVEIGQEFELSAQSAETYNLRVEFTDPPCLAYLADGDLTRDRSQADEYTVPGVGIVHVMVPLRENPCSTAIHLQVESESGLALPGISAQLLERGSPLAEGVFGLTDEQGVAELHVWPRTSGDVDLVLSDLCGPLRVGFLHPDGRLEALEPMNSASSVAVFASSRDTLTVTVPDDWCSHVIEGELRGADGTGVADSHVAATGDGGKYASATTDSAGKFRLHIPEPSKYRVSAQIDGCTTYYGGDRPVGPYWQAESIAVGESGDEFVAIQLSEGMCELRLTGRLRNSDGTPGGGQRVRAFSSAGSASGTSAPDGFFSVLVPGDGGYGLSVWIDGCWIYLGDQGPTVDINQARRIEISGRDASGTEFLLPERPAAFCD
ncbi:MAG: carboxypeptidase regulatory-like domain-containing protein [Chloroflexi bacterium]|nr:carboxypeptidase regulatory-like domain-containing protein [Chloroflexota bacterium]